jgi:hypothetical protein
MNDDFKNNSFDELLGAALDDYVRDEARPGLESRIIASLPARRFAPGWGIWGAFATASVCAIALLSLHLHRPSAQSVGMSASLSNRGARIAQTSSIGRPESKSQRPSMANPAAEVIAFSASLDPRSTRREAASAIAESADFAQSPAPATANGDAKIEPIAVDPLVVPPLSGEEAATQPIPPIKVEPIQIAPIQISKLEIETSNFGQ